MPWNMAGIFDPKASVEFSYLRSARAVSCRIRDPGQGFSLKKIPHAAVSNPSEAPFQHLEHREERERARRIRDTADPEIGGRGDVQRTGK